MYLQFSVLTYNYLIHWLQAVVEAKDTQLQQKDDQLQQKNAQLQQKNDQLQQKDDQLQQKDDQLQQKNAQLQQKDCQLQRQGAELRERTLLLNRQQRELRTLRVRNGYSTVWRGNNSMHCLVVRRKEEGCSQRWRPRMMRLTDNREHCKYWE